MSDLLAQLRAYGEQLEADRALGRQDSEDENWVPLGGAPRAGRRWRPVAVAAVLFAVLVVGLSLVARRDEPQVPADDVNPSPIVTEGWVVFGKYRDAAAYKDVDVYRVRYGEAPVPVNGADTQGVDEVCPTLSPGGDRLAFVERSLAGGANEQVVVAAVSVDGSLAERAEFTRPSSGTDLDMQCPSWSPDGQNLGWVGPLGVTVLDVAGGATTDVALPAPRHDFEWAPDGDRFAVSSDRIRLYARSADGFALDADLPVTAGATYLSWAEDGTRIAYFVPTDETASAPEEYLDLEVVDIATSEVITLGQGFTSIHGFGPVWSPVSDEIVYQRVCAGRDAGFSKAPCREEHEVVIVTPENVEQVLPELVMPGQPADESWWPFAVTWTPTGDELLYLAWANHDTTTGLFLRPVDPHDSDPVLLTEGPELAVYTGSRFEPWGRRP